MKELMRQI